MVPGIQHKTFRSFDGTEIAYQVRGQGPCVVLANGLGGTHEALRHVYAALGDRYRVLSWDYRGLHGSARPADLRTLAVPYHCHDLALLLDHEGIERAVCLGWSMGVQVVLELFREHRRRMAGIVAINGTYGLPFRTAMASRLSRHVIPPLLLVMKTQARLFGKATDRALAWDGFLPLLTALGLISRDVDMATLREVGADFRDVDWAIFSDTLRLLGEHDARDLLTSIDVPTLIMAGTRDLFTPVFTARRMCRSIPGSRLVILPGATHYAPLEHPATVGEEIGRFLAGVPGWGALEAPDGAA